jgi:tetratricopeptide (TPR) repeat protein
MILGNQLDQAIELFSGLKTKSEDDPRPYFFTGLALIQKGRMTEAGSELKQAVERDPRTPQYVLAYANLLLSQKKRAEAGQQLENLSRHDSSISSLETTELWLLSNMFYELEDHLQSIKVLQAISERTPEDGKVFLRIGQVRLLQKLPQDALEAFSTALSRLEEKGVAHYGRGLSLWELDRIEEARGDFQSAVDLKPQERDYLFNLAVSLLELKRGSEALEHLKKLEKSGEGLVPVYRALANAYQQVGDLEQTERYIAKFSKPKESDEKSGYMEEAISALGEGQVAKSRGLFLEVLEDNSDSFRAHSYLARIYLSSQQWASAKKHLERLLQLQPESLETHYLFSDFWYQRGYSAQAQYHGERARSIRSRFAPVRNLLGNIYAGMGQISKAIEEYEAAVEMDPENPMYPINLKSIRQQIEH